jgi:hypothetical protein
MNFAEKVFIDFLCTGILSTWARHQIIKLLCDLSQEFLMKEYLREASKKK